MITMIITLHSETADGSLNAIHYIKSLVRGQRLLNCLVPLSLLILEVIAWTQYQKVIYQNS